MNYSIYIWNDAVQFKNKNKQFWFRFEEVFGRNNGQFVDWWNGGIDNIPDITLINTKGNAVTFKAEIISASKTGHILFVSPSRQYSIKIFHH